MNVAVIKKWIEDNLVMQDEARTITNQSISGFNQSVATGKIEPFIEFGKKRKTRLYLRSELKEYAVTKQKERIKMKISVETCKKNEHIIGNAGKRENE